MSKRARNQSDECDVAVGNDRALDDPFPDDSEFQVCEGKKKKNLSSLFWSLLTIEVVNKYNFDMLRDVIIGAAKSCDFYAVDMEFSGLDNGDNFRSKDFQVRYGAFRDMVNKYGLLQVGLCFMKRVSGHQWRSISFTLQVFPSAPFQVAPKSMVFLAQHGVCLTDIFRRGMPFDDPVQNFSSFSSVVKNELKLQSLWHDIAHFRKPIVMHNGLTDLLFLWKSFFSPLPVASAEWIAGMSRVFPSIWDTKYISEYMSNHEATYLQRLFRESLFRRVITLTCTPLVPHMMNMLKKKQEKQEKQDGEHDVPTEVCPSYATHGHCHMGPQCPQSHDVDFIVRMKEAQKRSDVTMTTMMMTKKPRPNLGSDVSMMTLASGETMAHSAGLDAVATAVVMASFDRQLGPFALKAALNRLYLMYYDRPLLFVPSKYGN